MKATIYTYSIIYSTSEAFKDQVPYVIALVDAENGTRIMSQIDGYKDNMNISIGMEICQINENEFKFIT